MRITPHLHTLGLALGWVLGMACPLGVVWAAPYELRMYSDDTPKHGDAELELLLSLAQPKPNAERPLGQVVQTLVEYGYGLGHGWSIGLELPSSHLQGQHKVEGLKAEVQYVAAHSKDHGGYWGVRGDVGYTSTPYDSRGGNSIGINPILGYRWPTWHLTVNPSLEIPLSGPSTQTLFQPSAKLAHAVTGTGALGLEYFSSWGALSSVLPVRQRDESLYVVWDEQRATTRWHLGFGKPVRATSSSVDQWVLKLGVSFDVD
jgi:hypothetical protein